MPVEMWVPLQRVLWIFRRKLRKSQRLLIVLGVLATIVMLVRPPGSSTSVPGVLLTARDGAVELYLSKDTDFVLTGALGLRYEIHSDWQDCNEKVSRSTVCMQWSKAKLTLTHQLMETNGRNEESAFSCYTIWWNSKQASPAMDCYNLAGASWYGGGEIWTQHWPINNANIIMQPYVTGDVRANHEGFGSVLQRYWLSSQGVALYVDESVPLHVSINSNKLCLMADHSSPSQRHVPLKPDLKYHICVHSNARTVHENVIKTLWSPPGGSPSLFSLAYPTWSTKSLGHDGPTQRDIEDLAAGVRLHTGFAGRIEVDSRFFTNVGDYQIHKEKIPKLRKMLAKLHAQGFQVYAWHSPYVDSKATAFDKISYNYKYFLHSDNKDVIKGLHPFGKTAATIDFTNDDAVKWQRGLLSYLIKDKIHFDGLVIEGGHSAYLPHSFNTNVPLVNPNFYAQTYAAAMFDITRGNLETSIAYRSQYLPVCVRLAPRTASWGKDGGLKTVIPSVLNAGLIGYPCVIPGSIGGDASTLPDPNLYKRWVSLAAFLPIMQFHHLPWTYRDGDIVDHVQNMIQLHIDYVAPKVKVLLEESVHSGFPVIRPLWWNDPANEETFHIDSEFLIGDDILVAPILQASERSRDIYLPRGRWRDMLNRDTVHHGYKLLKQYSIAINQIAYFEKVAEF